MSPDRPASYHSLREAAAGLQHQVSQGDWAEAMRQPYEKLVPGKARLGPTLAVVLSAIGFVVFRFFVEPTMVPDNALEWAIAAVVFVLTIVVAAMQSLFLAASMRHDVRYFAASAVLGFATPAVFKYAQELFFELPDVWVWILIVPGVAALFFVWWALLPLLVAKVLRAQPR